jgi:hypothetical protein
MAVLIEGHSVVVRRGAIEERFRGGWHGFLLAVPNATACYDEHLVRVGFMDPADVAAKIVSAVQLSDKMLVTDITINRR